jgi:hypothetical protein
MLVAVVPYLVRMRTTLRPAAAAVVLVAALSATACTPPPEPPRTPAPSSTPLFASDEEALAAAEAAYAAYQTTEDLILAEGGANGERIIPFAVRDALEAAIEGFETYQAKGYRSVGAIRFKFLNLQSTALDGTVGRDVVIAYVCLDFSGSDVLDANGQSVVRAGRPIHQQFQVSFDRDAGRHGLVLSSRDPSAGSTECSE